MPYGNMFNRPQVPMNRPMTPMNRVSSAPASTPGISALLAGKPALQPMQQPVRQDVSSMGLGSLPQGPFPYGAIQTGQLGSQPIQMGPPSDFQGQQRAQQQLDNMLVYYSPPPPSFGIQQGPQAQQNQMGTLANLSQMFNTMGQQQPAQQGGTPLQNNSSPLQQSAQPVMNPGVM